MKHKKKMNRRERIDDYINQRMEGFSKVPNVLADRALKIGALSFLALFLGSYMGRQMDSASFIAMVSRYVAVWNRICVPSATVWGEKGI